MFTFEDGLRLRPKTGRIGVEYVSFGYWVLIFVVRQFNRFHYLGGILILDDELENSLSDAYLFVNRLFQYLF